MKTICAWCQRLITDGPPTPLSHGLCARCAIALETAVHDHGPRA